MGGGGVSERRCWRGSEKWQQPVVGLAVVVSVVVGKTSTVAVAALVVAAAADDVVVVVAVGVEPMPLLPLPYLYL